MITQELQATLNRAVIEAAARRHEFVTLEHLLLAMLDEGTASEVIRHCGGNLEVMGQELEEFFEDNMESLPNGTAPSPQLTAALARVFDRALAHAAPATPVGLLLFDGEVLDALPTQPWDRRVDWILTSSATLRAE